LWSFLGKFIYESVLIDLLNKKVMTFKRNTFSILSEQYFELADGYTFTVLDFGQTFIG